MRRGHLGARKKKVAKRNVKGTQPKRPEPGQEAPLDDPPAVHASRAALLLRGAVERAKYGATGQGIVWAVVDSGIDQRHPHFRQHDNLSEAYHRDFTADFDASSSQIEALVDRMGHGTHSAGLIGGELAASSSQLLEAEIKGATEGGPARYSLPDVSGVAPRCKLVSLRVLDDRGEGRESSIAAALAWVQDVNERAGAIVIHGVNLGIGYEFDPDTYACGHSPMCRDANRLVQSGVVVVAAAGNTGYGMASTVVRPTNVAVGGSINDPGNAEDLITVGSAHETDPFGRGVSYFSSKGPTIDGRDKPDIVAPGERMLSCVPGQAGVGELGRLRQKAHYREYTGTAAATAYVSGVIAALLSARPALIGKPRLVKRLLMSTAVDLKRHRHSQGRGLVDLGKALGESADAEHLALLESDQAPPPIVSARDADESVRATRLEGPPAPPEPRLGPSRKKYAVAFSYAGEEREYVKKVLAELRRTLDRDQIFYDLYYESWLSQPNLDVRLQRVYREESELVAVFISANYEKKKWTGVEWRVMREMIAKRRDEDVMPLRFDDTEVPGMFSIDGYVDLRRRDPENVADLILERLTLNRANGDT